MTEPRQTRKPCLIHRTHVPPTHINEVHHVWPKGDGGPDVPDNRVVVCATGHNNIHDLLSAYRKAHGDPGEQVRLQYTSGERDLAALGWARMQRGRMQP